MATFSASSSPTITCYTVYKSHKNPKTIFSNSLAINRKQSAHNSCIGIPNSYPNSPLTLKRFIKIRAFSATEEETTVIPDQGEAEPEPEPTVSVPVSPSDILTMFFQAEGTMSEGAIPSVTSALEETDGISDLRVQVHEGIASVELKKKTTVQATGVASNLVEIIQSSGFKLQALNLSFEDEDAN
uniref:uncharacterized protein LOC122603552 n=1 Tax=Erigeron canadensis TaxID=72917 RepID=UPI001CB96398|nr:uncharacterized protein LOC122603552 [Erigeron canadensis]